MGRIKKVGGALLLVMLFLFESLYGTATGESKIKSIRLILLNPLTNQEVVLTQGMAKPTFPLKFEVVATYENGYEKKIEKGIEWVIEDKEMIQIDGSGYVFFLEKEGFLSIEAHVGEQKAVYFTNIKWQSQEKKYESLLVEGILSYHAEGREIEIYGQSKAGEKDLLSVRDLRFETSDKSVAYVINKKLYFTGKEGKATIKVYYKNLNQSFDVALSASELSAFPRILDVQITPSYPTAMDEVQFQVLTNLSKEHILREEWKGKKRFYEEGIYMPSVRVQNDLGYFSQWYTVPLLVGFGPGDTEEKQGGVASDVVEVQQLRKSIFERAAADYQDDKIQREVKHHWAYPQIMTGVKLMYATRYNDGTFRPDRYINRGEMAASLALSLGFEPVEDYVFDDLEKEPNRGYVYALYERGILNGYEDGTFRPQKFMSRAEFAHMFARVIAYSEGSFSDDIPPDIRGHWAQDSISAMMEAGLMMGKTRISFAPDAPLTRAECMVVLERLLKKDPLIEQVIENYLR